MQTVKHACWQAPQGPAASLQQARADNCHRAPPPSPVPVVAVAVPAVTVPLTVPVPLPVAVALPVPVPVVPIPVPAVPVTLPVTVPLPVAVAAASAATTARALGAAAAPRRVNDDGSVGGAQRAVQAGQRRGLALAAVRPRAVRLLQPPKLVIPGGGCWVGVCVQGGEQ